MSERIDLELYQHDERPAALLLSLGGRYTAAHWIPRSLIDEPPALKAVKVEGVALYRGRFAIERWKAEAVGFCEGDTDDQGALF